MAFSKVTRPGIETSPAYRSAKAVALAPMRWMTRQDWRGVENLPTGGCVVAANHVSYADPFAVAHLLDANGHSPFFLAKDSLFRLPVLGRWLAAAGQVPVYRGTGQAHRAYEDAVAAVQAGRTVVVMPEGTFTTDPDGWPMKAKTGAVRIALAAERPLVPVGQWGAQELVPTRSHLPRPWPRKTMLMNVGTPLDLSDVTVTPLDHATLARATDRLMDAVTALVAELRGLTPPVARWDSARGARVTSGEETA